MQTVRVVLVCQLVLVGTPALGNGTFVAHTRKTSLGGIVPLKGVKIRLERETLRIKVGKPPHYTAHAAYLLDNPGPAVTLDYGVPMVVEDSRKPEEQARRIDIRVAGRRYRCKQREAAEELLKRLVQGNVPFELGPTWCVARVTIPKGKVKLDLRYPGELIYSDFAGPGNCAWMALQRRLVYPLWPAGYLAGTVDRVEATVELGPMADHARPDSFEPRGFKREGNTLRWTWRKADLKKIGQIQLIYEMDPLSQGKQMTGFNRAAVDVVASSPDAGKLLDNRRSTAWCPPKGVDAWVEQRLTEHPKSYVYDYSRTGNIAMNAWIGGNRKIKLGRFLHDHPSERWADLEPAFVVVHGAGREAGAFSANHRVRRLRVSLCGAKAAGAKADYTLPRAAAADQAAALVRLHGPLLKAYRAELDRWSARLRRQALPCLEICRARRIRRCRKQGLGAKGADVVCGQVGCEVKCMKAAAGKLKRTTRALHPCLRFTILELDRSAGAGRRTCIRELAPSFGRCW